MCLQVWIGTRQPVPPVFCPAEPDLGTGFYNVHEVPDDALVRTRFTSPHVTYVGSHEGCGCGFNSSSLDGEGFTDMADVMALLDAMTDPEREELLAELRSRERLQALVSAALSHGEVELYVCWAGDEGEPPDDVETVPARWLTERLAPLEEKVKYSVTA